MPARPCPGTVTAMNARLRHFYHGSRVATRLLCATLVLYGSVVPAGQASDATPTSWQAIDATSGLTVTLSPEHGELPVGRHHSWIISIRNKRGEPISNALVQLAGGMRGHGHGMPSQPVVTTTAKPGHYRASGVLFNMHGQWQIMVGIRVNGSDHAVEVPISVDY